MRQQDVVRLVINNEIQIDEDSCVATSVIADCLWRAAEVKRQIKALEKVLEPDLDTIKNYMGDKSILLLTDGTEGATWKRGADREEIDKEGKMVLKIRYPEVYNDVVELKEGIRRLEIKV